MEQTEGQLKAEIAQMDEQIADYEARIRGLKADRNGMMTKLVDLIANKSPIIIGS